MFQSLKLYKKQDIQLDSLMHDLTEFGYTRHEHVQEEGDFSRRGEIIDIFPSGFELPVRIELDNNTISSIKSFNIPDAKALWDHQMLIILPRYIRTKYRIQQFKEEMPLNGILDLAKGDYVVHIQYGIGRFKGVEKLTIAGKQVDHIVIEYLGHEKLFVPMQNMSLIRNMRVFLIGSQN